VRERECDRKERVERVESEERVEGGEREEEEEAEWGADGIDPYLAGESQQPVVVIGVAERHAVLRGWWRRRRRPGVVFGPRPVRVTLSLRLRG
jgi:hypothetical protein